jgi:hypothetical protein
MFIPCAIAESDRPKHAAHADAERGNKAIESASITKKYRATTRVFGLRRQSPDVLGTALSACESKSGVAPASAGLPPHSKKNCGDSLWSQDGWQNAPFVTGN